MCVQKKKAEKQRQEETDDLIGSYFSTFQGLLATKPDHWLEKYLVSVCGVCVCVCVCVCLCVCVCACLCVSCACVLIVCVCCLFVCVCVCMHVYVYTYTCVLVANPMPSHVAWYNYPNE